MPILSARSPKVRRLLHLQQEAQLVAPAEAEVAALRKETEAVKAELRAECAAAA